ncbi:hypothetical protein C8035_v001574 [Colletotrichum spinosum]|uniref:Uncharacterized protein n=1 Tax=Colletotrichum spinosum TaxID=1347390 RepID=A0A4V3HRD7_9PEZI|nr:hypothetical protein C8035_v001574 [Colletotrichum spinosum]
MLSNDSNELSFRVDTPNRCDGTKASGGYDSRDNPANTVNSVQIGRGQAPFISKKCSHRRNKRRESMTTSRQGQWDDQPGLDQPVGTVPYAVHSQSRYEGLTKLSTVE